MDIGRNAFGKLRRDSEGLITGWHPLADHMTDVAACFYRLAQCRGVRRAMEASAGRRLTGLDIARLAVLVFLHDIGKANSGFQAKRWKAERDIPPNWPVRIHRGHGSEAFKLFDDDRSRQALAPVTEKIGTWGDAWESLLIASISHHGRPVREPSERLPPIWQAAPGVYDPAAALQDVAARVLDLYPEAFEQGGEPLPTAPAFGHLFAGLVQLVDWLGSDTRFFKYTQPREDRTKEAAGLAAKAVAAIGLDFEGWRDKLATRVPSFAGAFNVEPRPIQAAMGDKALGPLVILASETGSGKTEAALWRYVHLFQAGLVDSLYFALPTRTAATQIYTRVQHAVRRLWPDTPPLAVRALPGYASADGATATPLPDFEVLWADHPDEQKAHTRWAAESVKRSERTRSAEPGSHANALSLSILHSAPAAPNRPRNPARPDQNIRFPRARGDRRVGAQFVMRLNLFPPRSRG